MIMRPGERRFGTKRILLAVVLAAVLAATPAAAKQGFYLGMNLLFNDISGDMNTPEWVTSGSGLGLRAGFGVNRYLAFEAGLWETRHDLTAGGGHSDLKAGTLDLKINFPVSGSHIEPYILAGVGTYTIVRNGVEADGDGVRFGLGVDIYLFPELSFNVGLTRNNATFKPAGRDADGRITTMDFGLAYHFL